MPFFEENPLEKLAPQAQGADAELDLRGLEQAAAMERVEQLLDDNQDQKTWLIRFDPAGDDGRETLFLPLGRRLLDARRNGQLVSCLPAPDGAAYVVTFTA